MSYLDQVEKLRQILKIFRIDNEWLGFEELTSGHINSTYRVYTKDINNQEKSYIVQKINTNVFKKPDVVMNNIDLITGHIRKKKENGALHFHHTIDDKNYYIEGKSFWRLYTFVEGTAYSNDVDPEIMTLAGQAFGRFQSYLSDFDATLLKETIPNFHNTRVRYEHLLETIKNNPLHRAESVSDLLDYIDFVAPIALRISDLNEKGAFPIRTTHNDTKINNVLIDKKANKPICVIDLDTVMPGLVMHDFGDAIRFGANKAKEDEKDLSKVALSLPLFEAFTKGFLKELKSSLTASEIDALPLGAITMTFEVAIRFLDDYIDGDNYFKIDYEEHNLVRAKCQLALLKDMISHIQEMKHIVHQCMKN